MGIEIETTHRLVLFIGGVVSLIIIPAAISSRRGAFLKRSDLRYDNVAIMWEKMFVFKAVLDASLGVLLLVSLAAPPGGLVCKGVGVLYQFEECMTLGIIVRMATHPFHFLLKREDMNETRQYFNHTVLLCAGAGLLVCAPLAAFSSFGHSYSLCWLTSVPMQFYAFFVPAMACLLGTITILVRLARVAHHRYTSRLPTVYHGDFFRRVARGLELHFSFLAFVGVYPYIFRIASRAYLWQHGRQHPVLAFLEYLTISFRGPLDALAYMPKDPIVALYRAGRRRWRERQQSRQQQEQEQQRGADDAGALEAGSAAKAGAKALGPGGAEEGEEGVVRLTLLGKARPLPFFTDQPTRTMAERRIFVSTYNMAECSLESLGGPDAMAAWVPLGADIYVIGVQECMAYEGLGMVLLAHVNRGEEGPEAEYVMYSKAIGSTQKALGYHGLIGVFVLAKAKDVRANSFMLHESKKAAVARGKNLGVTVAENKGGVGIAFRYHDTTFAFLNTHLASDLKGRSRLHKRNKDACQLLLETNLWREEYMVDLSGQHHVVCFLGDVNYRLKRPAPGPVLEDVAAICQRERDGPCGGREDWRQLRYLELLRAAAGDADKGRYGPAAAVRTPSQAAVAAASEDNDEDDEDDEDDEEKRRWRRLPALVGGLVRDVRSYVGAPSSHHRAELGLLRSLSSYDRQAQTEWEEKAAVGAAAVGLNGGGNGDAEESAIELGWAGAGAAEPSSSSKQLRLQEADGQGARDEPVALTWQELLEADELVQVMRSGAAFYGFTEPEIRFPPSYRRIKGPAGECGDYTDAERLKQAYSIQVKEKGLSFAARRLSSTAATPESNDGRAGSGRLGSGRLSLSFPFSQGGTPQPSQLPQQEQDTSASTSRVGSITLPGANSALHLVLPGTAVGDSSSGGARTELLSSGTGQVSTAATTTGGDGGGASSSGSGGKTTNRVPSYTDRILVTTFPDYAARVRVGPYELCDACIGSDHRPVSTLLRIQVNVGVRGLQTFHHGRRTPHPASTTATATATAPAAPKRDVICVNDAAFYLLELTDVSVELAPFGRPEGTGTAPDDEAAVLCLFPLDNEDCFSILRRPAIVASVAKTLVWLTTEEERDPFAFLALHSYGSVRRRGLSIVSCNRPEMGGLHASFALCDYRGGALGSCVIALSDADGQPIPQIRGGAFPLTVGGCRCGTLRCDVRITQLWLDGNSAHL